MVPLDFEKGVAELQDTRSCYLLPVEDQQNNLKGLKSIETQGGPALKDVQSEGKQNLWSKKTKQCVMMITLH